MAYYAVARDSGRTEIQMFEIPEVIISHFGPQINGDRSYSLAITNDSLSNAPLLYHECWNWGFDTYCVENCDSKGAIPPGGSMVLTSKFQANELGNWDTYGIIFDNSTNSPDYLGLAASGSISRVREPNYEIGFTPVSTSDGLRVMMTGLCQNAKLTISDVLGRRSYEGIANGSEVFVPRRFLSRGVNFITVRNESAIDTKRFWAE